MSRCLLVLVAAALTGCGTSYEQKVVTAPQTALAPDRAVLISQPPDGFYGPTEYEGSGRMTAAAMRAAFLRFAPRAEVTTECHGTDCLERARAGDYAYYVQPDILHWEDRATEWSGKSDRAQIRLTVHDAATRQEIASQVLAGKSSWWTFGGDHPQDLLHEPITAYVAQLYR